MSDCVDWLTLHMVITVVLEIRRSFSLFLVVIRGQVYLQWDSRTLSVACTEVLGERVHGPLPSNLYDVLQCGLLT